MRIARIQRGLDSVMRRGAQWVLMQRNRRLAYMAEMGIEPWLPVKALPGAKAGHWLAPRASNQQLATGALSVPGSSLKADSSGQQAAAGQKVLVNRGLALAEVLDLSAASAVPAPVKVDAKPAAAAKPAHSAPAADNSLSRFTLVSSLCGDLLLIDDIDNMSFAGSAYQHWLNAILSSLGRPASAVGDQLDRFEWPLADSGLFDSGQQAAKEIVSAWLLRKLEENTVSWVLLMGQAAVATLANVPAAANASAGPQLGVLAALPEQAPASSAAVKALLTHGSAELWRQPLLKREFWQHLQLLRSES